MTSTFLCVASLLKIMFVEFIQVTCKLVICFAVYHSIVQMHFAYLFSGPQAFGQLLMQVLRDSTPEHSRTCLLVNICVDFCWIQTQEWRYWMIGQVHVQFLQKLLDSFSSGCIIFYSCQLRMSSRCSTTSSTLGVSVILILAIPVGLSSFSLHFLLNNNVECLFMCLLAVCTSSFKK